jgi:tetratricopeptide (TPR) repeat protein
MIANFIRELRRRNVFRAAISYAATGWFVVQIADVLLGVLDASEQVLQTIIIVLAVGLPFSLIFSWFFNITSEGIKRTADIDTEGIVDTQFDRRMNAAIIAILVAALLLSVYGNLRSPEGQRESVSILIADFENQTGNELFSGVLEDFLLVGLEVAPFVSAYPRKAATDLAANLPGADPEAPALNPETAALIALREGIDIVVSGSVNRDEDGLTVLVNTVTAGEQQEIFTVTETVKSDADVLTAIVDISAEVRKKLGKADRAIGAGDSESFAVTNLEAAAEYLKAQNLQLDRKLEEAVIHYEQALLFDPDFARAYAGLALTQQYLGNSDAATTNWQETLSRLDRLTERGRLRTLGNYFMINQGNYEKALETYETLVEKYPADNVAQNNLAVTAFYAMDFERALEVGREVTKRYPGHSGYGANLALYAMYASRFDEAADVANTVIANDPSNAYSFLVLALASAAAGDLAETEQAYQHMTNLDQFARSVAAEGLADLAIYRGDYRAALEILDNAIEDELALAATHTVALKRTMKVEVLLRMNETEKARVLLDSLVPTAPDDPAILVPAAISLIELGDSEAAVSIADKMSRSLSGPHRAYALGIKASVAAASQDVDAAVGFANSAVATVDLWLVRFIRARVLLQKGMTSAAAADLQNCQQRVGEGMAVFLNDRPSFRLTHELEMALGALGTP